MIAGSIGDTEVGGGIGGAATGAAFAGGGSTGIGAATAAGAFFGGCPVPDGAGSMAATAALQAGDSRATCVLRHCRASLPPGVTPAQFAAKSARQDCRMASVWACARRLSLRGHFSRRGLPCWRRHFGCRSWRRGGRCRRFRDRGSRRRWARRCSRHDRAYGGPARRRQLGHVLLQTIQGFLPTRLHARAVRPEIGSAGLAYGVGLRRRRLLRLYRSNCHNQKQAVAKCRRAMPHPSHASHPRFPFCDLVLRAQIQ